MGFKKGFCSGGGAIISYESVYHMTDRPYGRKGEVYFGEGGKRVVCADCGRDLKVTSAGLTGRGAVPRHKRPSGEMA